MLEDQRGDRRPNRLNTFVFVYRVAIITKPSFLTVLLPRRTALSLFLFAYQSRNELATILSGNSASLVAEPAPIENWEKP